jgi:hypothetical protein
LGYPSGVFMRSGIVVPAALVAAALALTLAGPARADIVVNIDKNTQRMTVSVDGEPRYEWPVSTGRAGYDTPNGTFKVNRMDAEHLSQEWDNAPMPHSMFFDMRGHAIHGFFDVKHLGLPVSHGCVRISPEHAAILYKLVEAEGMKETKVVVSGTTPAYNAYVAQRRQPAGANASVNAGQPMQLDPRYGQPQQAQQQPAPAYDQQPYYGQQPGYAQPQQQYYGQAQQPYYGQVQQPYYAQAPQSYSAQPQPNYYVQPGYQQQYPQQQQYYVLQPYNRY